MTRVIVVVTAFCAAYAAAAADQLSFKGFRIGAAQDAVSGGIPGGDCRERQCTWSGFSYGGVDVRAVSADFRDKKLASIFALYDPMYFEDLASALTEKYGGPTIKQGTRQLGNRVFTWSQAGAFLKLTEREPRLENAGIIYLSSPAGEARAVREQHESAKTRAKDL